MGNVIRDRRPGGNQVISRPAIFHTQLDYPWKSVDVSALMSLDHVIDRVVQYSTTLVQLSPPDNANAAAVLVALFEGDNGTEVVLTRRSQLLTNHKGEISFPGGRVDADERVVDTALREAYEEINLPPENVEVVGQLSAISTYVSNNHIVPVVARLLTKPSLDARNGEVDRVFSVPLIDLVRHDTYVEELWDSPSGEHRLHFFHLDDETIWGATGYMLFQLISIALAD